MPLNDPPEPSTYPPSQTALILIDYYESIIEKLEEDDDDYDFVDEAESLLRAARFKNVAILHCLESHPGSSPSPVAEYKSLAPNTKNTERETVHTRPPDRLSVLDDEGVTRLLDTLGVRSLIIAGTGTSGAVLSTALHGVELGFVVSVVGKACWDKDYSAHKDAMKKIDEASTYDISVDFAEGYLTGGDRDGLAYAVLKNRL
ncbi:Isochorismatase hydrolase [Nemania sp. NC0429]|nr:Isochorismatase hydrolase [Nemania sp. NC0429]